MSLECCKERRNWQALGPSPTPQMLRVVIDHGKVEKGSDR